MTISATCLTYGHRLATLNEVEFSQVEGLVLGMSESITMGGSGGFQFPCLSMKGVELEKLRYFYRSDVVLPDLLRDSREEFGARFG